jgi:hypothetical protein
MTNFRPRGTRQSCPRRAQFREYTVFGFARLPLPDSKKSIITKPPPVLALVVAGGALDAVVRRPAPAL